MTLPPMKALVAFEAAARLRSFTLAAGELHLTHGAISRQIALLEAHYGRPLFLRLARGVALSEAGARLLQTVQPMLARLAVLTQELRDELPVGEVHISVTPSFCSHWLLPRLQRFSDAHPEIAVRFDASLALADLNRSAYDFAVRYGAGHWKGVHAQLLMRETLTPVCRPDVAARLGPLDADLPPPVPLLDDSTPETWQCWLHAVGKSRWLEHRSAQVFNDYNVLLEAALNGIGLAIGRSALTGDLLASGRLVAPYPAQVASPLAYYLVRSTRPLRRPAAVLWAWLAEEAGSPTASPGA